MASSLSNFVDNLAEGIHKIKCKHLNCFPEYESVKDNLIKYKSFSCNKEYLSKTGEDLKKRFRNTFELSNIDISEFILLLRKGAYPYEYMDEWDKFNETSLPEKYNFYSNPNIKDIADSVIIIQKEFVKILK